MRERAAAASRGSPAAARRAPPGPRRRASRGRPRAVRKRSASAGSGCHLRREVLPFAPQRAPALPDVVERGIGRESARLRRRAARAAHAPPRPGARGRAAARASCRARSKRAVSSAANDSGMAGSCAHASLQRLQPLGRAVGLFQPLDRLSHTATRSACSRAISAWSPPLLLERPLVLGERRPARGRAPPRSAGEDRFDVHVRLEFCPRVHLAPSAPCGPRLHRPAAPGVRPLDDLAGAAPLFVVIAAGSAVATFCVARGFLDRPQPARARRAATFVFARCASAPSASGSEMRSSAAVATSACSLRSATSCSCSGSLTRASASSRVSRSFALRATDAMSFSSASRPSAARRVDVGQRVDRNGHQLATTARIRQGGECRLDRRTLPRPPRPWRPGPRPPRRAVPDPPRVGAIRSAAATSCACPIAARRTRASGSSSSQFTQPAPSSGPSS